MANYLGFNPTERKEDYYFISYSSEDVEYVGAVSRQLHNHNIPLWYDYGIDYGKKWEAVITERIRHCTAVILFFSPQILHKKESYVLIELEMAQDFDKPVYVVLLKNVVSKNIPEDTYHYWVRIRRYQGIAAFNMNQETVLSELKRALNQSPVKLEADSDQTKQDTELMAAKSDKHEENEHSDFYKQLKEFNGCRWGPQREMFSMNKPSPYPVMNSLSDNNVIGDERNFFRLREVDSKEKFGNLIKVQPGKEYEFYTLFCNAGKPSLKENGTLHNVRLQVTIPRHIDDHKLCRAEAVLTSDNSDPGTVWCGSFMWSEVPVDLEYVQDSARLHSDKTDKEGLLLSPDVFKKGGTLLGIKKLDGELPCTGLDCVGHVLIKMKAFKSK